MAKGKAEVSFRRTPKGQCVYDVLMSRLSAKECVRRWPTLKREFVLKIRRDNPNLRPLTKREKGGK